jgi:hypothetical protein
MFVEFEFSFFRKLGLKESGKAIRKQTLLSGREVEVEEEKQLSFRNVRL